jgi:hypothetical protein
MLTQPSCNHIGPTSKYPHAQTTLESASLRKTFSEQQWAEFLLFLAVQVKAFFECREQPVLQRPIRELSTGKCGKKLV